MTTKNPFKSFKTSPEIIKLSVMYYIWFPLRLRQVEDILRERAIWVALGQWLICKFLSIHAAVLNQFSHRQHFLVRPNFKHLRVQSLSDWRVLCTP